MEKENTGRGTSIQIVGRQYIFKVICNSFILNVLNFLDQDDGIVSISYFHSENVYLFPSSFFSRANQK